MCVAEQGDAIRFEIDHGVERRGEARLGLPRQAVHHVDVHVIEAERTCLRDEPSGLHHRLVAPDRVLDGLCEVLHAEADGVEVEVREGLDLRRARRSRIELDRAPCVLVDGEVAVDRADQGSQRARRKKVWRAAPERDLGDRRPERPREHRHLGGELVDVPDAARRIPGRDDVASAVRAQALAERDVHVQRDGRGGLRQPNELGLDPVGGDRPELRRGGIARVSGPTARVLGQTGGGRFSGREHHEHHPSSGVPANARRFRARPALPRATCRVPRRACTRFPASAGSRAGTQPARVVLPWRPPPPTPTRFRCS